MFVLDTNILSELRRRSRANPNVTAWAAALPAAGFFLSSVTLFELELGVQQLERRDPPQGAVLRSWLRDQILQRFEGRILPVDAAVAVRCAQLHVPDPRSFRDAFIAATALVHGMTVVTRNTSDFVATGVRLLNPWEPL